MLTAIIHPISFLSRFLTSFILHILTFIV